MLHDLRLYFSSVVLDVSFAVGCSDGSVYLFSQSGAVEDQQSLDFVHTKVITADFIPVSQLKWCPRYSHFQGSSQDCDTSEDTKRRPNGNPDEESGLLCSKRSAVAVVIFRRGVTSQVKYVSGLHTLPISGAYCIYCTYAVIILLYPG